MKESNNKSDWISFHKQVHNSSRIIPDRAYTNKRMISYHFFMTYSSKKSDRIEFTTSKEQAMAKITLESLFPKVSFGFETGAYACHDIILSSYKAKNLNEYNKICSYLKSMPDRFGQKPRNTNMIEYH
jgi:hypothetical protein